MCIRDSSMMAAATRVAPWDVQPCNLRSTISARARSIWWRQALEKGQQRGALIREFARWQAALRTGHDDLVLDDIGADIKCLGWGLHDVSPMIKIKGCLLYTSPSPRDRTRSRMP